MKSSRLTTLYSSTSSETGSLEPYSSLGEGE
jgi:hypothetical protein